MGKESGVGMAEGVGAVVDSLMCMEVTGVRLEEAGRIEAGDFVPILRIIKGAKDNQGRCRLYAVIAEKDDPNGDEKALVVRVEDLVDGGC